MTVRSTCHLSNCSTATQFSRHTCGWHSLSVMAAQTFTHSLIILSFKYPSIWYTYLKPQYKFTKLWKVQVCHCNRMVTEKIKILVLKKVMYLKCGYNLNCNSAYCSMGMNLWLTMRFISLHAQDWRVIYCRLKKGHRAKKKNGQKLIVRYDLFQKQLQAKLPFYKINPKFCKYLEQYLDIYACKLSYAHKHQFNIWLPESSNLNVTNFLSLVYFIS